VVFSLPAIRTNHLRTGQRIAPPLAVSH
jgi:hypothetical protein